MDKSSTSSVEKHHRKRINNNKRHKLSLAADSEYSIVSNTYNLKQQKIVSYTTSADQIMQITTGNNSKRQKISEKSSNELCEEEPKSFVNNLKMSQFSDQYGLIKVELDEDEQHGSGLSNSGSYQTSNGSVHSAGGSSSGSGANDAPTGSGGSHFQNSSPSNSSSHKYYIVERGDPPPVQQQYILQSQYGAAGPSNSSSQRDCDALNLSQSGSVIQRSNSEVPILKKEAGPFKFTVELDEKEDTNKTPSWLMNSKNKLYTNINKAVPFHVKLGEWPAQEHDYQVRVTAVFSSHQYARAHVKRCPIHASPQHQTNIDFPFPEHVVRLDHPNAVYEKSSSGRLSVVVPLEQPQTGPLGDTMPLLLRFMCLCSCSGGINRRPLAIIFTLEKHVHVGGKRKLDLYGRQTVDVRVCACPMRDYRNEEGNFPRQDRRCGRKRGGRVAAHHMHHSMPTAVIPPERAPPIFATPKLELMTGEELATTMDELYTIPVRGAKLYEFLMEMKHVHLKMHPDYNAQYPDVEDEVLRMDGNIEEEQRIEDESISVCQEPTDDVSSYAEVQQLQVAAHPPPPPIRSNARMNGTADCKPHLIHQDSGTACVSYSSNSSTQDIEMVDQDYSESSQNSFGPNQSPQGRSASFSNASIAIQNNNVGPSSVSYQANVVSSSPQSTVANAIGSNVASVVTHSQIIGSVKGAKSLPGNIVSNGTSGTSNSPVFLIYNANSMDNHQLVQTLNTRKIILPRPTVDQQQQTLLKTSSGTVVLPAASSAGSISQSTVSNEDGPSNGVHQSIDVKPSMSDSFMKRDASSSESDEVPASKPQQFRHIPIAAVAQNARDQRKGSLCVAKKMPRLKSIPGRLVSQAGGASTSTISVSGVPTMIMTSQQMSVVGAGQSSSDCNSSSVSTGQFLLARSSSANGNSHQILVPLTQTQSLDTYPNLALVKREPHDYEEEDKATEKLVLGRDGRKDMNNVGSSSGVSMNGEPDSAEMLAAQVLASSLGSRQIPSTVT